MREMATLSIDEIKDRISPVCKQYDVSRAYLFGSYARGEATENSDVDIRIDKGDSKKLQGLFDVSAFQLALMDALGREIDLITILPQQELYAIFRKHLVNEEVLIYEAQ